MLTYSYPIWQKIDAQKEQETQQDDKRVGVVRKEKGQEQTQPPSGMVGVDRGKKLNRPTTFLQIQCQMDEGFLPLTGLTEQELTALTDRECLTYRARKNWSKRTARLTKSQSSGRTACLIA